MHWTAPLFLIGSLAGAALPPFNGFISEFMLYTGLLHSAPGLGIGRVFLLLAVAMLALVGGLSALSATRSFGLIFLGVPRDKTCVHANSKENPMMIGTMLVHLAGILAIGMFPGLGVQIVSRPTQIFLKLSSSPTSVIGDFVPMTLLNSLTSVVVLLVSVFSILMLLRFSFLPTCNRRHVTWGCGYTAANTRMQYTGSSFSDPMVAVFRDLLKFITRQDLPQGVFPKDGKYETHCIDSVERKIFTLLENGEKIAGIGMRNLPEHSSFSFAAGLIALILLVSLVSLN
jgi:hydrogenase-4 component B